MIQHIWPDGSSGRSSLKWAQFFPRPFFFFCTRRTAAQLIGAMTPVSLPRDRGGVCFKRNEPFRCKNNLMSSIAANGHRPLCPGKRCFHLPNLSDHTNPTTPCFIVATASTFQQRLSKIFWSEPVRIVIHREVREVGWEGFDCIWSQRCLMGVRPFTFLHIKLLQKMPLWILGCSHAAPEKYFLPQKLQA